MIEEKTNNRYYQKIREDYEACLCLIKDIKEGEKEENAIGNSKKI